ncbi:hypothetical protein ACJMK2_009322 [Sinanodonta woodiana]|uniref:Alpha-type protein kinase domain-containing protein n=1 Tax=Sinanodonta woodiana TaxID=1069815 RepID=A0ABD3VE95_SINWO
MGIFDININNTTLPSNSPWKDGLCYWSSFELYPDWMGTNFDVFRGFAYHGDWYHSQTDIVVKAFKDLNAKEADWNQYKARAEIATRYAKDYNRMILSHDFRIRVEFNIPVEAVMDSVSDVMVLTRFLKGFKKHFSEDEYVIIEDYLGSEFRMFVSERGSTCCIGSEVLAAFAHFTYHTSNGDLVICKFKGIFKENVFRLSNPTIHSVSKTYGPQDGGSAGLIDFFENHKCNNICKNWSKHPIPLYGSMYALQSTAPIITNDVTEDITKTDQANNLVVSAEVYGPPPPLLLPPPKVYTEDPPPYEQYEEEEELSSTGSTASLLQDDQPQKGQERLEVHCSCRGFTSA